MSTDQLNQLEAQLATAEAPRQRVDLLNEIAVELLSNNLLRALELSAEALQISKEIEDANGEPYRKGQAESKLVLCRCEGLRGNYAQSLALGLEALEIFEKIDDLRGQGFAYNALGMTYLYMGNYPEALTTLLESLDVFDEIDNSEWQAGLLNSLGYLYLEIEDPNEALKYLMNGLVLAKGNGLTKLQGDILNNACKAFFAKQEYEQAVERGLASISCYRQEDAAQGEAETLNSLGKVYQAQGSYEQALECHQQALEISEQLGSKFVNVEASMQLGRVYRQIDRLNDALKPFEHALRVAEEIDARHKVYECHKELAEVYKGLGDYKAALEHFEQFQKVERSVFSDRADNRMKSLQVMHQLGDARHKAEISQLRNVELQNQIEARELLISDLEAFANMVAHDLRNPLSSIMMSVSMALELLARNQHADLTEYLTIARNMAERMGVIIRELLVLASVRQKDVTLVVVDMDEIVRSAIQVLSYQIEQAQAEVILPDEWPQVFGYPAWIEEIWTNYISNAIKYGGIPPKIELGYTREELGRVRFWVHDNGDGVTPEKQERLFTSFSRLDRGDAKGYGLGLSIVQRIASKLDGEVGVASDGKPGEGSTFYFTLPGMIEI